jgi:formate dehydrogenase
MAKILCVLYDDPIDGYPKSYERDDIPKIDRYPGGQSAPTPKHIDFKPGELLGSVSGELGLRKSGVLDRAIFQPFSHHTDPKR